MEEARRSRPRDQASFGIDVSGLMLFLALIALACGAAWEHMILPLATSATVAVAILGLSVIIYRSSDDDE